VQSKAVYPKSALSLKQEGTVTIKLTIAESGNVLGFKITKKSEFNSLNSAALKLAKKIQSFRPVPHGFSTKKTFTIPVNYILN
jgi:TonB family protein